MEAPSRVSRRHMAAGGSFWDERGFKISTNNNNKKKKI